MTLIKKPYILIAIAFVILAASCSGASTADQNGSGGQAGSGAGFVDLLAELESSGATVESVGEVSQPFFSVDGQIVKVDGVDVQIFEYGDAAAALAETEMISSDGSSVGTTMISWVEAPHFYLKDHFIVLYVGNDSATIETLQEVLGPQFAGR